MKNKLIVAACLIGAALVALILLKTCKHRIQTTTEKKEQQLERIRYVDTTSHWRDAYSNEHALRENAEGVLQQLKGVYQDALTAKTKELGIKENRVQSLTRFTVVHDTIATVIHSDTIRRNDTVYIRTTELVTDNAKDSLSVLQYLKKTGWFRRTPYIDIVDYSPTSHVENIQGFRVTSGSVSWLSVGPAGAMLYTGNRQFVPAAGIGVVLRVWKIPVSLSLMKVFN